MNGLKLFGVFLLAALLEIAISELSFGQSALVGPPALGSEVIQGANGREYHTGFLGHHDIERLGSTYFSPSEDIIGQLPEEFDLRTQGMVAKIKDQGSCGSCWSFAITGALESARLHAGLPELNLSEQQMVSCVRNAYGCEGGFMSSADYAVNPGLALESDYPYTARNGSCRNPLPATADKLKSWAYVGAAGRKPTVDEMKAALVQYGVLFVTVSAGGSDWDGRSTMTQCGNRSTNHMVNIVGWTRDGKWIVKNSWGTDWGDNGFAYAPYGCDNLANEPEGAAFVVYEGGPCTPAKVKLPAEMTVAKGTETMLGVRYQQGVTYKWFKDGVQIGTGPMIYVTPQENAVYKLVGKNACGQAESSVSVKVVSILL